MRFSAASSTALNLTRLAPKFIADQRFSCDIGTIVALSRGESYLEMAMRDAPIQRPDFDDKRKGDPMKCVWMLGGVVDYKLCDRQYECEQCPFDAAIREGAHLHRGLEQMSGSSGRILVQGYELMPMLFYHPNHLWARIEDGGSVRIGLDDFGQRLMGRLYAIELSGPGTRVSANAACWRVAHHAGETSLAAPVSGHVLEVNTRLLQHPSLINRDPYGEGWALVIKPDCLEQCLQQLYYGSRVQRWYEQDIEKLYWAMSEMLLTSLPGVGPTMQDGGSCHPDFLSSSTTSGNEQVLAHPLSSLATARGTAKSLLTAEQMRQMINSFLSAPVSDRSAAPGADVMGPNQGR